MNVFLVVAENEAVRETLRTSLPDSDLVLFEGSVDGASRRLVSIEVDIILLDDGPNLGGPAIPALKATAPGTPVVVLSTRGDLVTQANLVRAGADHVVLKPFSCDALRETLGGLLRHGRQADATAAPPPEPRAPAPALGQHQMALRWLSRASSYSDDPARLATGLVDAVVDIFNAARCAVLLEDDGSVHVAASHALAPGIADSLRLGYTSGLMRWFDEHACIVDHRAPELGADAAKELHVLGGRLAVPLVRNGRVFGALVLGEKASGLDYSNEERDLLTMVGRASSVAFERADAHADTRQRSDYLDTLLARLPTAVVAVAPDKTVRFVNPAAESLLEVRATEVVGRSVQKLGAGFARVVLTTLADGEARSGQHVRDVASGTDLLLDVAPMTDGGVSVAVAVPAANASPSGGVDNSPYWRYLASRVAQEIKNPMVAVNTFAQLLPRKYDSEEFRDGFSRVVQQEVGRINRVVEGLFEFAQASEPACEPHEINTLIRDALGAAEERLHTQGIVEIGRASCRERVCVGV